MRMLQSSSQLYLSKEALRSDRHRQLRAEDLHRHLAIVAEVVCQVDGGHAATAELALEPIAVAQRFHELWWWCGHLVSAAGVARIWQGQCRYASYTENLLA